MAYATVPWGRYFGWTAEEIQARLATLKTAVQNAAPGQGAITSTGANGTTVSFDVKGPGAMSIEQEIAALLEALAYVDDTALPVTNEAVFSTRRC
jgi:hypothetical protein